MIKIGSLSLKNNIFLAPMAGITDLPFRTMARKFGCGLCYSEMVSSNGLTRGTVKSYRYLESSSEDKPLGIQIFGSDPDILAKAAVIATDKGADLIDINMGCPVKKVLRTGAGSALMRDPRKVTEILKKVRKSTQRPLTIKIRSGWNHDEINAPHIAQIAQDCGIDAVTLHPRTAKQGFSGIADWNLIEQLRRVVSIPIIGNGDIRSSKDASEIIKKTGCNGIMIGRGALGNPWLFSDIINKLTNKNVQTAPSLPEIETMIYMHLKMSIGFYGEQPGMRIFKKHLLWYTKGLRGSSQFRQLATTIDDKKDLIRAINEYFIAINEQKYFDEKMRTSTNKVP